MHADDYANHALIRNSKNIDDNIKRLSLILSELHGGQEAAAACRLQEMIEAISEDELRGTIHQLLGPLTHSLAKMLQSEERTVQLYAARTLKLLLRDDVLRIRFFSSGTIVKILITKMSERETDAETMREILSCVQNLLYDAGTASDFASVGGLRSLVDWMDPSAVRSLEAGVSHSPLDRAHHDVECRLLALACACNALSHCDGALNRFSFQMRGWIEHLMRLCSNSAASYSSSSTSSTGRLSEVSAGATHTVPSVAALEYSICAVTNALFLDPGLAHSVRSVNGFEILERCRHLDDPKICAVADLALQKLSTSLPSGSVSTPSKTFEPYRFKNGSPYSSILYRGSRHYVPGNNANALSWNQILGLIAFFLIATCVGALVTLFLLGLHRRLT